MALGLVDAALLSLPERYREAVRSREVLIAHMAKEKDANVLMAIRETLPLYFPDDPAVAQALKEAETRVQK